VIPESFVYRVSKIGIHEDCNHWNISFDSEKDYQCLEYMIKRIMENREDRYTEKCKIRVCISMQTDEEVNGALQKFERKKQDRTNIVKK